MAVAKNTNESELPKLSQHEYDVAHAFVVRHAAAGYDELLDNSILT